MAEEELEDVVFSENDIDTESETEEEKPAKKKLSESTLKVLKSLLQYLVVAIIAFLVSISVNFNRSSEPVEQLIQNESEQFDVFVKRKAGSDWTMEEMMVNTADEDFPHIVKAKIVVSYDDQNKEILSELSLRGTEIHSEVRNIIGSKKYAEINTTQEQKILAREIKTRIQLVVGMPGIIDIFFKDFTVH